MTRMQIKNILRYGILAGVFAIPFIPFIVSSSMFFPFITGKNFTFRIITEILFALWAVLALHDAAYRPRFSWLNVALVAFLVVIGLADLLGANPFQSFWSNFERMEGYITLLHLAAYFLVASTVLATEKVWDAWWMTSLGAATIMACNGLWPILGSIHNLASAPRIDATFGNPIYLAIYNVFNIFIALYLWSKAKQWRPWHVLYIVIIVLQLLTLFFSLTRGAVIGLFGGLIITTVLIGLFERQRPTLRKGALITLGIIAVIIGGFLAIKNTEFAKTTPVLARFATISFEANGTIGARYMIWNIAWQGVKEHPILGWGQNNFDYVFAKYYTPNMWGQEPWFDRTHDIVFDWLIAGGFLGLMTYFATPSVLLYYLWLYRRKESVVGVTEKALWTGLLAAYTFHNLFVFDNLTSYILYISVLAFLAWRITLQLPQGEKVNINTVSEKTTQFVTLPIGVAVAVVLVWSLSIPGIQTSQTLIKALSQQSEGPAKNLEYFKKALAYDHLGRQEVREQLVQAATQVGGEQSLPQDLRAEFVTLAKDEMTKELTRNPNSARLQIFMGSFLARFGMNEEAMTHLEKARTLSPKKQTTLFQIGDVLLREGKFEDAYTLFKSAYELDPAYEEALKLYALSALYSGHGDVSDSLLKGEYGTTAVDDSRFLAAYTQAKRYSDVVRILEGQVKKDPKNPQTQVQLAAAYYSAGQKGAALKLLEDLAAAQPQYKPQLDVFINDIKAGRRPGSSTTTSS